MSPARSLGSSLALALAASVVTACAATPPLAPPVPDPGPAAPAPDPDLAAPGLRLPTDVRPLRYALELEVTPGAARVSGTVTITLELDRPRRVVWLHAEGLHVTAAALDGRPATFSAPGGDDGDGGDGLARVALDPREPALAAGRALLTLSWDGPVGQGGDGIFDVSAEGRHYTLTTFEPVSARAAFPCFDEPRFKVPWELTLVVPRDDVALSAAPVAEETPLDGGRKRVRFEPSAPLPTYLVSFAVGPFDVVAAPSLPPSPGRAALPIRGVALRGRGAALAHQLAEVGPIVTFLEGWFGRPYPYAKLDVVATPGYPGAMENAALVLFDEYALFVDPSRVGLEDYRSAENTLAHELSHQWFGNLVTMAWWDDLWLNEAFATWMAVRVVTALHPELAPESQRLREWRQAMAADAKVSARRIRQPIVGRDDMLAAFDAITYQKGASLITMFEHWVGAEVWQAGVRAYLADHAFGSATTDDLLAAVAARTGYPVAAPFRTFLDATGAPLVTVEVGAPAGGALPVRFHVERLRPVGSPPTAEPDRGWQVPVCLAGPGLAPGHDSCVLVTQADQEASLPFVGARATAVAPNAGGVGYYQALVRPEPLLRAAVTKPASAAEAAASVQSYAAAFETGGLSAGDVLTALAPLASSPEPELALAPLRLVQWVADYAATEADAPALARKARALYGKVAARLGWGPRAGAGKDPADGTSVRRAAILDFLARTARDPGVRREAARRGRALVAGGVLHPESTLPELRETALAVAVEDGDLALYDAVVAALRESQDPVVRDLLLHGLTAARAPEAVAKTLGLVLDPALTDTELLTPLMELLGDRRTQRAAWDWLTAHFDAVVARMPPFSRGFLPEVASGFCDASMRAEVEAFFTPRLESLPGSPRSLAATLEAIGLCDALVAAQGPSARAWLADP